VTGWRSHPWLRGLRPPVLVVHGDKDPVVPLLNARYLAGAVPGARLEVVRGGGHLFLFDEPERAIAPIAYFLDGRP
jgi:pimeloyl-ACP methyl ester carboxylesterase